MWEVIAVLKYCKLGSFIILIFILFGCADTSDNHSDEEALEEEWRFALSAQPATLDTHMTTAIVTRDVARNIFETLVTFNSDYEVTPMLAESFDVSEDGKTYTFHLRQGVKFHNGDTMTAEDVVASMNRWLERSMSAQMLLEEAAFEKKDDDTVALHVKEPSSILLSVLAATNQFGAIMPEEIIDNAGINEYVGTGPFKFVEWKQDQYIHLERFDDYQSVGAPSNGLAGRKDVPVKDIYFDIVTDSSTRISGIQTGQYDIAEGMPYQSYEQIKNDQNINVHAPFYGQQVLIFEKYEGVFANPKMREAVNLAIDTDKVSLAAFSDNEDIYRLTSSYMLKEQPWFSEAGNENYNQNNIEKAKTLLTESGYNGEEVRFLTTRDIEHIYNASVVVQQQLKEIGMYVSLEVYDWATILNMRTESDQWELFLTGFPAVTTPAEFLAFTSQYYIDPDNEKYMTLYDKVKSSLSIEDTYKAWEALQEYAWEYLPVIKLSDFAQLYATSKDIKHFTYLDGPVLWNMSE